MAAHAAASGQVSVVMMMSAIVVAAVVATVVATVVAAVVATVVAAVVAWVVAAVVATVVSTRGAASVTGSAIQVLLVVCVMNLGHQLVIT